MPGRVINTCIYFTDAAEGPDTLIGVKPEPEVETVTKIVYIKRFINQTRQITKTVPSKQEVGIREPGKDGGMNLYLAITIGNQFMSDISLSAQTAASACLWHDIINHSLSYCKDTKYVLAEI